MNNSVVASEYFERILGKDLLALILELGAPPAKAVELTRLPPGGKPKACYKITLDDTRIFKARRFPSEKRRKRVQSCLEKLQDLPFNRILLAKSNITIEQWIEGKTLTTEMIDTQLASELGALLGRVHIADTGSFRNLETRCVDWYQIKATKKIDTLIELGALPLSIAVNLKAIIESEAPQNYESGIIHTDYCPDNIVIQTNGDWFVIDNENLALGPLDFDLARTNCRWNATREQRLAFLSGYAAHRSIQSYKSAQRFWTVCASALSAASYLARGYENRRPLEALLLIAKNTIE